MPKKTHTNTFTAALVFALDAGAEGYPAGCNAHIFPDGVFRSDDGRPASLTGGELRDWQMNAGIAAGLALALANGGKPILYDYEHNSLYGDSRAAGWIDRLDYVEGKGLFGHVEWTPDAAEDIAKKVYRYSSPFFSFDPKSGAVTKLLSVALTNNPALGELGAVELARKHSVFSTEEEAVMAQEKDEAERNGLKTEVAALAVERDGLKTSLAALTAERDGLKTSLAALTAERDTLKAKVETAEKEKAEAALAAEKGKHGELLQAALTDGRLTPAQKDWAEKQTLAALTEYLDASMPLGILQRQADGKDGGGHELNQEELAMCTKMGVTPEVYAATKSSK